MLDEVMDFLSEYKGINRDMITSESHLIVDLGLTSFDIVEMCCELEERFHVQISEDDLTSIKKVYDIVKKTGASDR
jgi:acyl carrier protein